MVFLLPPLHPAVGKDFCSVVVGLAEHMLPDTEQVRLTQSVNHIRAQPRGGGHLVRSRAWNDPSIQQEM